MKGPHLNQSAQEPKGLASARIKQNQVIYSPLLMNSANNPNQESLKMGNSTVPYLQGSQIQKHTRKSMKQPQGHLPRPQLVRANSLPIDEQHNNKKSFTNLLKFMQEQLELIKKNYENKHRQLQKETGVQLGKLQIKLKNNEQLIMQKDRKIKDLLHHLNTKNLSGSNTVLTGGIETRKIDDLEKKMSAVHKYQVQLDKQMSNLSNKIKKVEEVLIRSTYTRLNNMKRKQIEYIQVSSLKLSNTENLLGKISINFSPSPNTQLIVGRPIHKIFEELQLFRQDLQLLKNKELQYDNIHISTLQSQVTKIKDQVKGLQLQMNNILSRSRQQSQYSDTKRNINPKSKISNINSSFQDSSQRELDLSSFKISNTSSYYNNNTMYEHTHAQSKPPAIFEDYQLNYSGSQSIYTEGQFFHPMNQSFQKSGVTPTVPVKSQPNIHNQSFQNFTSEDEDDDPIVNPQFQLKQSSNTLFYSTTSDHQSQSENQIRIMRMFTSLQMRLPVRVEVFNDGRLKIYGQEFLADENDNYLRVSHQQLTRLKVLGYIIF